jgi:hypothetical protein
MYLEEACDYSKFNPVEIGVRITSFSVLNVSRKKAGTNWGKDVFQPIKKER